MEKLCLNLGCGSDYKEGFINCDINPDCDGIKPDKIIDLEKPLPFPSNTVDFVFANQVFEHIKNFVDLMIEIHRILKPNGILEARVPLFPCRAAIADPDHIRFFVPESFGMFCNPGTHPYFKGRGLFDIVDTQFGYNHYEGMSLQESKDFFTCLLAKLEKVKWVKDNKGEWIIEKKV